MARLACKCGHSMWNGHTPNDIEFTVFSDARVCELADHPPERSGDPARFPFDFMDLMEEADYEVWRCPVCGRLYVFDQRDNPDRAKYVYRLEERMDIDKGTPLSGRS